MKLWIYKMPFTFSSCLMFRRSGGCPYLENRQELCVRGALDYQHGRFTDAQSTFPSIPRSLSLPHQSCQAQEAAG